LNGGPLFKFNESVSFRIFCDTREEIDYCWNKLSEGGHEGKCCWFKDRFRLSSQIVTTILPELIANPKKAGGVMNAFMQMTKSDIEKLVKAQNNWIPG
jgi:predicted 3-demethylubiquinone-9 3-methyltransferase (glyoxalase superfamily)